MFFIIATGIEQNIKSNQNYFIVILSATTTGIALSGIKPTPETHPRGIEYFTLNNFSFA